MAVLGFLGKKAKPNLSPSIEYPQQNQLYFTSPTASQGGYNLRDIFAKRLKGEGLGFGAEFVDKTANPVIAQREASFRNKTVPFLSNQLSARGVSRSGGSGLATGILGEAELSKNRDVDEIFSKMYQLNKMQEKTDFGQALGEANYLQGQEADMLGQRAAANERLTDKTAADAYKRMEYQDKGTGQLLGLGMAAAAPFTGGASLGGGSSLLGGGNLYDGEITDLANLTGSDLYNQWLMGQGFNALGKGR